MIFDMFLIFSLARQDVFPTGDLVIQKGYAKLYNMKNLPNKDEMLKGSDESLRTEIVESPPTETFPTFIFLVFLLLIILCGLISINLI